MKFFETSKFDELFEKAPDNMEYSDIPEENMEDFNVFMRLMEAKTPKDIRDISFDTVLGILDDMLKYAGYLESDSSYASAICRDFSKLRSENIERIL